MGNELTYDKNFLYFFHGTNELDMDSFIKNGLTNYRGTDLKDTTWRYTDGMYGSDIKESVRNYAEDHNFANVVLIKIPFRIVDGIDRNGNPYIPIPIWKNEGAIGEFGREVATLVPELIAGTYNKDNDTFVENENYSTSFNPNGLSYDLCQIDHLNNYGINEWYDFAVERMEYTYNELLLGDNKVNPFDDLIKDYIKRGIIQRDATISSKEFLKWGIDRGEKVGMEKFKRALNKASTFIKQIFDHSKDGRD